MDVIIPAPPAVTRSVAEFIARTIEQFSVPFGTPYIDRLAAEFVACAVREAYDLRDTYDHHEVRGTFAALAARLDHWAKSMQFWHEHAFSQPIEIAETESQYAARIARASVMLATVIRAFDIEFAAEL